MSAVEDLVALLGDEHVVLDANAPEAEQGIGPVPVDLVAQALAGLSLAEQRRDEVDPRLDGDHVAGL